VTLRHSGCKRDRSVTMRSVSGQRFPRSAGSLRSVRPARFTPANCRSPRQLFDITARVSGCARPQALTPSLDGLPIGVARIPFTQNTSTAPNPKDSPVVWNGLAAVNQAGLTEQPGARAASPMPAPIGAGDVFDLSEFHTPKFRSTERVSPAKMARMNWRGLHSCAANSRGFRSSFGRGWTSPAASGPSAYTPHRA
jgi:hypothetical protein